MSTIRMMPSDAQAIMKAHQQASESASPTLETTEVAPSEEVSGSNETDPESADPEDTAAE